MIGLDYRMLTLSCLLLVLAFAFTACNNASGYGSSVDDMVGAFSIEKTIRIGSSSACFSGTDAQNDPLSMGDQPPAAGSPALADDQPPGLAGFDIEPKALGPSSESINLTAHIIDDGSGLNFAEAFFCSPFNANIAGVVLDSGDRVSGTPQDGTYEARMALPKSPDHGAWLLENLTMVDQSGNRKILNFGDMARMGLPVEFLVP
jgi:predicted small secreted protein